MRYRVIYSRRRTMQLEISREAELIVRAPMGTADKKIKLFLEQHREWIAEHLARREKWMQAHPEPTEAEKKELIARAKAYLPKRTMEYAAVMGVEPTGIRITSARTRFGSCSAKNSICYSWRLMQYPKAAVDYVVVHELAHILHKDHSRAFYKTVERYLPDYRERQKLLKS